MLDFEVALGPFRLALRLGDAPPEVRPQGDVFATVERADTPLSPTPEDRAPIGFRGR